MRVELLHFEGCPHVPAAREQLRRAFAELGLPPTWHEVDVLAADAPASLRGYGSPTVLVDGRDVTGAPPGDGVGCRVYAGSDLPGAPPLVALVTALRAASSAR